MSNPPPRTGGATSIGGPDDGSRKKKPWWLLLLLLASVIVLVLFLLSQCGGSDEPAGGATSAPTSSGPDTSTTESGSPTSTSTPSEPTTTSPTAGSGAVTATSPLTANGAPMLPLAISAPDGILAAYTGQTVQARGAIVLNVPADEGFWVGTSETDQVWVQLTAGGESPYQVSEGDTVDFDGTMVAHDVTFAEQVGVTADEGADQLTTQGQHVEVARNAVTLTQG